MFKLSVHDEYYNRPASQVSLGELIQSNTKINGHRFDVCKTLMLL